jgi:hypothetical protein
MNFLVKILISASLISFSAWLAQRRPALAGFILALPISSMIAILFLQWETRDSERTVTFAKSIFSGVPLSLTFFLPFLLSRFLRLPFWGTYLAGLVCLSASYWVHRRLFSGV